jgi:two-component system invasion response regulator UvrY
MAKISLLRFYEIVLVISCIFVFQVHNLLTNHENYTFNMDRNINILIIEDHDIIIWALEDLLQEQFRSVNVESAHDFASGVALLESNPIDLVILDINVPGGNSTTMIDTLREIRPSLLILIYTGLSEQANSLEFLSAGAHGFLSKTASLKTLGEAVDSILRDKKYISPSTYEAIAASFFVKSSQVKRQPIRLTEREQEITKLILRGKWTKEIAQELGLKVSTVSTHKTNIFEKFGVNNPIDLFKQIKELMPQLIQVE